MAEYHSFSGIDISAVFGNTVFGELQMVSYKSDREKAPVYTMGSPDPRTIARGKRLVTGVCVFVVFDKDSLVNAISQQTGRDVYLSKDETANFAKGGFATQAAQGAALTGGSLGSEITIDGAGTLAGADNSGLRNKLKTATKPLLGDQLLPFDITLVAANEYGQVSKMVIHGVELMTEAGGISIDDLVLEKQMSFIAKRISSWEKVN